MKKSLLRVSSILLAATIFYSCSSTKNSSVSGNERTSHERVAYKRASSNVDAESMANYSSLSASNYQPSVEVNSVASAKVEETAVASAKAENIVLAKKETKVASEITSNKITKAEFKAAIKEVIKSKDLKNTLKDLKSSDSKGTDKQTIAIILSLVALFFFGNAIALHRWYMYFAAGHKPSLLVAILDLIFAITFVLWIVSIIWGLIDIIRLLTGSLKV